MIDRYQAVTDCRLMTDRKPEYYRLLSLAVAEEAAAAAAKQRKDDIFLVDGHRNRAAFFRKAADNFLRTQDSSKGDQSETKS